MKFKLGNGCIDLKVNRVVNGGYAGCNQEAVKAHIDELAAIGVSVPNNVPTFYPVPILQLTTIDSIQAGNGQTSGEVEYVYIVSEGKSYITVGSDHSDRALEAYSVCACKQICPDIIAKEVWEYDSVKDHLDQIIITCEVFDKGEWRLYQEGAVTDLLSPEKLTELGEAVIGDNPEGLVLFSGTILTIGEIAYASEWRVKMEDKVLGKSISTGYSVERLPDCIS